MHNKTWFFRVNNLIDLVLCKQFIRGVCEFLTELPLNCSIIYLIKRSIWTLAGLSRQTSGPSCITLACM